MRTFRLAEHFVSINGEGRFAGELALFLRFAVCDLRCDWCDTLWAVGRGAPYVQMSAEQLVGIAERAISDCGVRNVTLTGGEPLLQDDLAELCGKLSAMGLRVEIETNGARPLAPFLADCGKRGCRPVITMDYKLPSSKMESRMHTANFAELKDTDTLKFVCASREDLERAAEVLEEFKPVCAVYLSPVHGRIDPAEMVEFMKERRLGGVRLQLQLHKYIWEPERRGV